MAEAAIFGARQLIDAPIDPQANADSTGSSHSYGIAALARALLKFERYDDILKDKTIPWRDILDDKVNRNYFEARAYLGKGDLDKAEKRFAASAALKEEVEKNKGMIADIYAIQQPELKGRIALARGETLAGLQFLSD